jgi:tetratricopeptide (TPR) repeat protein
VNRTALAIGLTVGVLALGAPARAGAPAAALPPPGYEDGQALVGQKRYAEAVEKLRPVTAAQPDFAAGWYALALAARRAGNCTEAIPAYRRYAALRTTEAEPYFGLGLCLRDTGDRPAAVAAFKRFLELEHRPGQEKWIETAKGAIAGLEAPPPPPGGAAAAYEEAQRLRDRGKVEAALKRFADAVALDPDLIVARAAWGELLLKVHREKDAVPVFRGAVERNPQYPLAWYDLAFALRETAQYAGAIDAYRRYIALRPTDPDPHYGMGRALHTIGRYDEARRSYETYVKMENRASEQRWVAAAKRAIAGLDALGVRPAGLTAAPVAAAPAAPISPTPGAPPTPTAAPPPPPPPAKAWVPPPLPPMPHSGGSTEPPPVAPAPLVPSALPTRDPAPAQPR